MKKLIIISIGLFVMAGCKKDNEHSLSQQDKVALENLNIYLKKTQLYSDSVQLCCDSAMNISDSLNYYHYDSLLHHCNSMFEYYHSQFSHNDSHCNYSDNQNGNRMMGGGMHNNNSDDQHCNNSDNQHGMNNMHSSDESHMDEHYNQMIMYVNEMDLIMEAHNPYHHN